MRISPPPLDIDDEEGFSPEKDLFGLTGFGQRMANLVCRIDEPMVLALDSAWGSGKTTFIKQWAGHLRTAHRAPVIYFDAFANDFQEDAFVALAGEIIACAEKLTDEDDSPKTKFVDQAKQAARLLLPMLTKIAIKVATLGALSGEDLGAAETAIKDAANDVGGLAEGVIAQRLNNSKADRELLKEFRISLENLALEISQSKNQESGQDFPPLVIIIDELDRCRPTFALNVLERIKHLFSVNKVVFVLVTNLDQLAGVVEHEYGIKGEGRRYLDKFITLQAQLPHEKNALNERRDAYAKRLIEHLDMDSQADNYLNAFKDMATAFELNLRDMERVYSYVSLYLIDPPINFDISPLVVGMCYLRHAHNRLFKLAHTGDLKWSEHLVGNPSGKNEGLQGFKAFAKEGTRCGDLWCITTGNESEIDAENQRLLYQALSPHFNLGTEKLLPWIAEKIDAFALRGEVPDTA